jgi:hypothetical protein
MAIMQCRECGGQISEYATKCELCGAPIKRALGVSIKSKFICNIVVWIMTASGMVFVARKSYLVGISIVVIGIAAGIYVHRFPTRQDEPH